MQWHAIYITLVKLAVFNIMCVAYGPKNMSLRVIFIITDVVTIAV